MKNKIFYVVWAVVILGAVFLAFKNISFAPQTEDPRNIETVQIDPNISGQTLPLSNDPKDLAWEVFQKYLSYNKVKDIEGVRSVVYQIAPVCADPKTRIDCEGRMGLAFAYGSVLKKADFVNVWVDAKQLILATDFEISEDSTSISRNRSIIFFIKDESDNWRLLSFSPFKGASTGKSEASVEEYTARINLYTNDQDSDGMFDYIEECIPADMKDTCVPTNPKERDTDGNGYWDGVQALMESMK